MCQIGWIVFYILEILISSFYFEVLTDVHLLQRSFTCVGAIPNRFLQPGL